ncbi:FAR1-related protein [Striga asiatica]|uniref:FAR1-related protein n=1 Tax=Striga asiatica TaxID=4170 RepID=A0A5A7P0V5_STRAF|nr:FAR1-related protein [Striga asiatica]
MGSTCDLGSGNVRVELSIDERPRFVPNCKPELKPFIGQRFSVLDDAYEFYRQYAECGFDIRRSTKKKSSDGFLIRSYIVCSREGEKNYSRDYTDGDSGSIKKRRRVSKRINCEAKLITKFAGQKGYVVDKFVEYHSHPLASQNHKHLMGVSRNMDAGHQNFILNCARANIGPMQSYKLFKEVVGGYSNVGCTSVDFKNFSRDLKAYAIGVDAQMVLGKLFRKRELCSAFFFEYDVDKEDKLTRLFWADPISRKNYASFGDVISFDATYSTNRY